MRLAPPTPAPTAPVPPTEPPTVEPPPTELPTAEAASAGAAATAPTPVLDLFGVGIGPFNLSLAALADAVPGLDACFLDAEPEFSWHPGMMLDDARMQVPFLADLVSLADPTSRWSFLAYLREQQRLFPFYFSEQWHLTRREYQHYCRWAADGLRACHFGSRVRSVEWDAQAAAFTATTEHGQRLHARNLVLGVGTEPVIPTAFADLLPPRPVPGSGHDGSPAHEGSPAYDGACGHRSDGPGHGTTVPGAPVWHSRDYLFVADKLHRDTDIAVIGSGQSGAEVFLDLLRRRGRDRTPYLRWITRTPALAPMEYSKLGLEHFTPDYIRYFHGLPEDVREELVPSQWQLYKAASADTLAEIHDVLYRRTVGGGSADAEIRPGTEVLRAAPGLELTLRHRATGVQETLTTGAVVLATGYAARRPAFLEPLAHLIDWDDRGRYRIGLDYRVATRPELTGAVYVQNAELHTHGVGAPDLGLGAYRAAVILNAVAGRQVHPLPARTAWTTFGPPGAN